MHSSGPQTVLPQPNTSRFINSTYIIYQFHYGATIFFSFFGADSCHAPPEPKVKSALTHARTHIKLAKCQYATVYVLFEALERRTHAKCICATMYIFFRFFFAFRWKYKRRQRNTKQGKSNKNNNNKILHVPSANNRMPCQEQATMR